jgi:hypothetical protein
LPEGLGESRVYSSHGSFGNGSFGVRFHASEIGKKEIPEKWKKQISDYASSKGINAVFREGIVELNSHGFRVKEEHTFKAGLPPDHPEVRKVLDAFKHVFSKIKGKQ